MYVHYVGELLNQRYKVEEIHSIKESQVVYIVRILGEHPWIVLFQLV